MSLYTEKRNLSCSCFLPNTSPMQHSCDYYKVTTSQRHHFPCHHFPSSPLPIVTTSLPHHFPSSPLPFVTTSLSHHFLPHHFPSSPFRLVTTSLPHHFPSSPLPFVTTSLRHHFPLSPLPFVTTSLSHHCPSSPLPFVATSLPHHCPSSPPCVIASYSFVMYCDLVSSLTPPCHSLLFFCDVLLCDAKDTHTHTPPFTMSSLTRFVRNTEVLLPNFLW